MNFSQRSHKHVLDALPQAEWMAVSPGRVNLLGGHVDYNDGIVLPAAIDRHVHLAVTARNDGVVNMRALDVGESVCFSIADNANKRDIDGNPLPSWALYSAGVCWALQQAGFSPAGFNAVFSLDIPIGAGLSSSAALELAFAVVWQKLGDWKIGRMQLSQICRKAENDYVGVNSGLMDQFACAHGVARHALYFDTRSLAWQPIPLPRGTSIVIVDSSTRRELTGSLYNTRLQACRGAIEMIHSKYASINSLRDVTPRQLLAMEGDLSETHFMRARHVVEEIERVKQGCQALFSGNARAFGQLMLESHASLRDLYAVSIPELDLLVETARQLPGCYGARLTGAGFGGCTVNLVESDAAEQFCRSLLAAFARESGLIAEAYICRPSRGVHVEAVN